MVWILWTAGATIFVAAIAILGAMAERYETGRTRERPTGLPRGLDGMLADHTARMEQLTQAVEAIAIEVERLGEGQRFVTKLLAERPREPEKMLRSPQPGSIQASPRPT